MFDVIAELRVGRIVEVSGSSIRIELDGSITELTRTYGGRVYAVGQFGSMLKIHFGRKILFAYVRLLRMRSELEFDNGFNQTTAGDDSRVIDADLFGEASWYEIEQRLDFERGLRNYPLPGQNVFLTTHEELQVIYSGAEAQRKAAGNALVAIGEYVGTSGAVCYANVDKLFGQHSAVLGSTGSGKSATVAAIVHAVLEHSDGGKECRPRIVIIDPHAEYVKAFGTRATIYRAFSQTSMTEDDSTRQLRLPYWLLSGEELRELIIAKTIEEATSENNIIYKALTHARLAERKWIEKAKIWVGETSSKSQEQPDDARPLNPEFENRIQEYDRDTPDPFTLDEFIAHIRNEQGIQLSAAKTWTNMSTSSFKSHAQVLDKISVLRNDPRMSFMMQEYCHGQPDLPEIIQQFVGGDSIDVAHGDIKVIDISGLPNEVAGPVAAAIARLLFQYKVWQTRDEREQDPILFICEEAHRYVPDHGRAEYETAQKAVRRIAKEGRKYGLGLMLVSQRPSDVERTVLSQCNSWIVMRLTNPADQAHVSNFLPDSLQGLVKLLPALSRREAIFVGEAAAIPSRIFIKKLSKEKLPASHDVAFMASWNKTPAGHELIEKVVKRWRRENEEKTEQKPLKS